MPIDFEQALNIVDYNDNPSFVTNDGEVSKTTANSITIPNPADYIKNDFTTDLFYTKSETKNVITISFDEEVDISYLLLPIIGGGQFKMSFFDKNLKLVTQPVSALTPNSQNPLINQYSITFGSA